MKFPITIDEFDISIEKFVGEVGRVYSMQEYEVARKTFVNSFPYSYTFYDQTGKAIL